jgi:xanthine dehydrogenase molybdopterin-binding subunit B
MAAYELGKTLQRRLAEVAAGFWEVGAAQVTVEGTTYACGGEILTFREIARMIGDGGVPVMASASTTTAVGYSTPSLDMSRMRTASAWVMVASRQRETAGVGA